MCARINNNAKHLQAHRQDIWKGGDGFEYIVLNLYPPRTNIFLYNGKYIECVCVCVCTVKGHGIICVQNIKFVLFCHSRSPAGPFVLYTHTNKHTHLRIYILF